MVLGFVPLVLFLFVIEPFRGRTQQRPKGLLPNILYFGIGIPPKTEADQRNWAARHLFRPLPTSDKIKRMQLAVMIWFGTTLLPYFILKFLTLGTL